MSNYIKECQDGFLNFDFAQTLNEVMQGNFDSIYSHTEEQKFIENRQNLQEQDFQQDSLLPRLMEKPIKIYGNKPTKNKNQSSLGNQNDQCSSTNKIFEYNVLNSQHEQTYIEDGQFMKQIQQQFEQFNSNSLCGNFETCEIKSNIPYTFKANNNQKSLSNENKNQEFQVISGNEFYQENYKNQEGQRNNNNQFYDQRVETKVNIGQNVLSSQNQPTFNGEDELVKKLYQQNSSCYQELTNEEQINKPYYQETNNNQHCFSNQNERSQYKNQPNFIYLNNLENKEDQRNINKQFQDQSLQTQVNFGHSALLFQNQPTFNEGDLLMKTVQSQQLQEQNTQHDQEIINEEQANKPYISDTNNNQYCFSNQNKRNQEFQNNQVNGICQINSENQEDLRYNSKLNDYQSHQIKVNFKYIVLQSQNQPTYNEEDEFIKPVQQRDQEIICENQASKQYILDTNNNQNCSSNVNKLCSEFQYIKANEICQENYGSEEGQQSSITQLDCVNQNHKLDQEDYLGFEDKSNQNYSNYSPQPNNYQQSQQNEDSQQFYYQPFQSRNLSEINILNYGSLDQQELLKRRYENLDSISPQNISQENINQLTPRKGFEEEEEEEVYNQIQNIEHILQEIKEQQHHSCKFEEKDQFSQSRLVLIGDMSQLKFHLKQNQSNSFDLNQQKDQSSHYNLQYSQLKDQNKQFNFEYQNLQNNNEFSQSQNLSYILDQENTNQQFDCLQGQQVLLEEIPLNFNQYQSNLLDFKQQQLQIDQQNPFQIQNTNQNNCQKSQLLNQQNQFICDQNFPHFQKLEVDNQSYLKKQTFNSDLQNQQRQIQSQYNQDHIMPLTIPQINDQQSDYKDNWQNLSYKQSQQIINEGDLFEQKPQVEHTNQHLYSKESIFENKPCLQNNDSKCKGYVRNDLTSDTNISQQSIPLNILQPGQQFQQYQQEITNSNNQFINTGQSRNKQYLQQAQFQQGSFQRIQFQNNNNHTVLQQQSMDQRKFQNTMSFEEEQYQQEIARQNQQFNQCRNDQYQQTERQEQNVLQNKRNQDNVERQDFNNIQNHTQGQLYTSTPFTQQDQQQITKQNQQFYNQGQIRNEQCQQQARLQQNVLNKNREDFKKTNNDTLCQQLSVFQRQLQTTGMSFQEYNKLVNKMYDEIDNKQKGKEKKRQKQDKISPKKRIVKLKKKIQKNNNTNNIRN